MPGGTLLSLRHSASLLLAYVRLPVVYSISLLWVVVPARLLSCLCSKAGTTPQDWRGYRWSGKRAGYWLVSPL